MKDTVTLHSFNTSNPQMQLPAKIYTSETQGPIPDNYTRRLKELSIWNGFLPCNSRSENMAIKKALVRIAAQTHYRKTFKFDSFIF